MGEAKRRVFKQPMAPVIHKEVFGLAEGIECTHVTYPDDDTGKVYKVLNPRWCSPNIDYLMTIYEDGTALVTVASHQP